MLRTLAATSRLALVRAASTTAARTRLTYAHHGAPASVLSLSPSPPPPPLAPSSVRIRILAAPINPADINTIQGVYPRKPALLPAVGGNEGVGVVVETGSGDAAAAHPVGSWVVPAAPMLGWWQTEMVVDAAQLVNVDALGGGGGAMDVAQAATLTVNPTSAYRMLSDFEALDGGGMVIQNGANSGVGRAVIQIAAARGIASVNVVRSRGDTDADAALADELYALGASLVVTDVEAADSRRMATVFKEVAGNSAEARPRLALNCVGGRSSLTLAKLLAPGSTHVTYGGMSMRPVTIPTGLLIFNDIAVRGFWMTRWIEAADYSAKLDMYSDLVRWMADGKLSVATSPFPFTDDGVARALAALDAPFSSPKPLFVMSPDAAAAPDSDL